MKTSSLTDRIRKVRIKTRSQQPLKYRIELVRSRSSKTGNKGALRMQEQFEDTH